MNRVTTLLLLGSVLFVVQCTRAGAPIVGTWQARANDLPAVTLVIAEHNGRLSGQVTFHFQQKIGDAWQITRENPEPLIEPRFAGQKLSFSVSHENAHPGESGPADPPVRFEMRLTGPYEGMLRSVNYGVDSETKMVRAR